MAKHKFLSAKEGGYFYRYYPNLKRFIDTPDKEPPKRLLLFADPPESPLIKINSPYLYGKFLDKYNDKGLTIELELSGEIIFNDHYTETCEVRQLSSILIIQVSDEVYNYPFIRGKIYKVTTDKVTELTA